MSGLEEEVGLDIGGALDSLDQLASAAAETLGSALTSAADTFSTALTSASQAAVEEITSAFAAADLPVTVDTSSVAGDIDSAFAEADTVIPVDADASAIPGEVEAAFAESGGAVVPVDADTTSASGEVQTLVGQIEAEKPIIEVDADTSSAEAAVSDLSASLDGTAASAGAAEGGMRGFGSSTEVASGAALIATGNVKGIGDAASGLGGGAIIGGTAALAAGIFAIGQAGLDTIAAEQRFNAITGDMAEKVSNVKVGNLNADLGELAIKLGTDDEAALQAAASIFQFGVNSGASREQAADFTNQVDALAARAVALTPSLGSTADVAESLTLALARGGPRAVRYGLDLNSAEINARALGNTHKTSAADLTVYEKATAGAQIASEKYGGTLSEVVAKGADNAEIKQRSLKETLNNVIEAAGRPVAMPLLETLKAAAPAVESIAVPLGQLASVILPPLATALQLVGPAIGPVTAGFLAMKAAAAIEGIVTGIAVSFGLLPGVLTPAAEVEALFAAETLSIAPAAAAASGGLVILGETAVTTGAEVAAGEAAATGGLSLLVGAVAVGVAALVGFGGAEESVGDQTRKMGDEFAKASPKELIAQFHNISTMRIFQDGVDRTSASLTAFKDIATANVGSAQRLLEALKANGENVDGYQKILDKAVGKQKAQTAAQEETKAASDALLTSTSALSSAQSTAAASASAAADGSGSWAQALTDQGAATKEAGDQLSYLNNEMKENIGLQGDVTGAAINLADAEQATADAVAKNGANFSIFDGIGRSNLKTVEQQVSAAEASYAAIVKQSQATDGLAGAQAKGKEFLDSFTRGLHDQLTGFGLTDEAANALIRSMGLKLPGALSDAAKALLGIKPAADPAGEAMAAAAAGAQLLQDYLGQIDAHQAAERLLGLKDTSAIVSTDVPIDFAAIANAATAMGLTIGVGVDTAVTKLQEAPPATAVVLGAVGSALDLGAVDAAAKAAAMGAGIVDQFGQGLAPVPDEASKAVQGAGARIQEGGTTVAEDQAYGAGHLIGTSFGDGIYDGMVEKESAIAAESAHLVSLAHGGAAGEAEATSPSKLFMRLGADIGEGLALGIAAKQPRAAEASAGLVTAGALKASGPFTALSAPGLGSGGGAVHLEVHNTFAPGVSQQEARDNSAASVAGALQAIEHGLGRKVRANL